jgi:hypothetical protein
MPAKAYIDGHFEINHLITENGGSFSSLSNCFLLLSTANCLCISSAYVGYKPMLGHEVKSMHFLVLLWIGTLFVFRQRSLTKS